MPLSSICHIRDSTRIDNFAANSRARTRSVSPNATLSAVAGTIFTRVTKLTNSARSRQHHDRIGADVILRAEFTEGAGDVAARQMLEQIDHAGAVGKAQHLPHRVSPHEAGRMRDRLIEQRERIAHRAFGGARDDAERLGFDLDAFLRGDVAEMGHQHVASTRRRSKRWQRDSTVTGTLRISVVAKTNLACSGGSSSVFRKALKAAVDSMWTSSMM